MYDVIWKSQRYETKKLTDAVLHEIISNLTFFFQQVSSNLKWFLFHVRKILEWFFRVSPAS